MAFPSPSASTSKSLSAWETFEDFGERQRDSSSSSSSLFFADGSDATPEGKSERRRSHQYPSSDIERRRACELKTERPSVTDVVLRTRRVAVLEHRKYANTSKIRSTKSGKNRKKTWTSRSG